MKNKGYIYQIQNIKNNKLYIGKATNYIKTNNTMEERTIIKDKLIKEWLIEAARWNNHANFYKDLDSTRSKCYKQVASAYANCAEQLKNEL